MVITEQAHPHILSPKAQNIIMPGMSHSAMQLTAREMTHMVPVPFVLIQRWKAVRWAKAANATTISSAAYGILIRLRRLITRLGSLSSLRNGTIGLLKQRREKKFYPLIPQLKQQRL